MIPIISSTAGGAIPDPAAAAIFQMDAGHFLEALPPQELFDLIVTSLPYHIGTAYEQELPRAEVIFSHSASIRKQLSILL